MVDEYEKGESGSREFVVDLRETVQRQCRGGDGGGGGCSYGPSMKMKGSEEVRTEQVGLGSGQAQVRFTRCQSFRIRISLRSAALTYRQRSVLAEPLTAPKQSATNSMRVGAEKSKNLTMTDLLMVCDVRGQTSARRHVNDWPPAPLLSVL
jgi:hypothetical protein